MPPQTPESMRVVFERVRRLLMVVGGLGSLIGLRMMITKIGGEVECEDGVGL